jgi:hypothetical protein
MATPYSQFIKKRYNYDDKEKIPSWARLSPVVFRPVDSLPSWLSPNPPRGVGGGGGGTGFFFQPFGQRSTDSSRSFKQDTPTS